MSLADVAPLLLVGGGKMGGAMLAGWLRNGLTPGAVTVIDPGPPPEIAAMLRDNAIACVAEPGPKLKKPAVLILAVKPQIMDMVLRSIAPIVGEGTLVLSIAAGTSIDALANGIGHDCAIVRAMPNTPAQVGRGITVCCPNTHVNSDQRRLVGDLLSAIGEVGWVDDEELIDAVTGVSGSGPAYVFYLAECMAEAGVSAGLPEGLAMRLARATVSGAGELMRQSDDDVTTLRENVTSKGGTTAAALSVLMEENGLKPLMKKAIMKAVERSKELGG